LSKLIAIRRIGKVFRAMPLRIRKHPAKGDIENPVEFVFNAPMGTNGSTNALRITGQRTKIKLHLTGGLVPAAL